ncbi:hypothetical protein D3C81_1298420 [compost metagenome]
MQWAEQDFVASSQRLAELFGDAANLRLPREEHQQAAGLVGQGLEHRLHHPRLDELADLPGPPPTDVNGEHTPFTTNYRCIIEHPGKAFSLQRRRHHQDFKRSISQQLTAIESQCQSQIRIQASLVVFVHDDETDTLKRRILLQTPCKNPLSHDLNARFWPDFAFQPDSVTNRFTNLLS